MSLSFSIGYRFSRAKKRNKMLSFISISSIIGIAVGVAVIIVGLSAMNGFEHELEQRVLSVIPNGEFEGVRGPIENWPALAKQITASPDIVGAAPYVEFTGLVEKGQKLKALKIRGVDNRLEDNISKLSDFIEPDVWQGFIPGEKQIILGKGIAEYLQAKVGDHVTLLIPEGSDGTQIKMPRRVRVQVVGLLTLQGQIDHTIGLLPLADAQSYQRLGDRVSGVAVKIKDVLNSKQVMRTVGQQLDTYLYLKSWQHKYGFMYRDIQLVRAIMYLVMVLVIGVACFNIVSTLIMAVKERASEIAILRTMGATDALIRRIFIWQGLLSGVLGSLIGSILGALLSMYLTPLIKGFEILTGHHFLSGDIYFVDFLPSQLRWENLLLVSAFAIVLSLLSTWYPASRATKLNPVNVLSGK